MAVVVVLGDEAGVAEVSEAVAQHARRHGVAALLKLAEPERAVTELPEDAEHPALTEEVEGGHQRPAAA